MLRSRAATTTTMMQRVIKSLPLADLLKLARDRGIALIDMNRIDIEYAVARSNGGSLRVAIVILVNEVLFREEQDKKKARSKPGASLGVRQQSTDE